MRFEYAIVRWVGDGAGMHRSVQFSHRDNRDTIKGQTLVQLLREFGDEGWEMVTLTYQNILAPAGPIYTFKRQLD